MIKRISFVKRKAGMSKQAFLSHWMGPHADIVRQLPRLRGLKFGVVEQWFPLDAAWDGVGELWFDDVADVDYAFSSEPCKSLLTEDRKTFLGEMQWCFVREHTALDPPADSTLFLPAFK
jgi:uncharacterized protein (TIGR02118 family)